MYLFLGQKIYQLIQVESFRIFQEIIYFFKKKKISFWFILITFRFSTKKYEKYSLKDQFLSYR